MYQKEEGEEKDKACTEKEKGKKGSRKHLFNTFSLSLGTIALVKEAIEKAGRGLYL